MYTHKTNTALSSNQVAYPIGKNKDAYYHHIYFRQDNETGEITAENTVIKNFYGKNEQLFKGTPKECISFIEEIVKREGEWVRDEKLNYVFQEPLTP